MGLYNFQPRFVPFILDGRKTHTIRAKRVNEDKPGNTMHLYTGLRTKKAKLLFRVPCVRVEDIFISKLPGLEECHAARAFTVAVAHVVLDESEKEALARRDGFSNFHEMMNFWNGRLPFSGNIIHWRYGNERTENSRSSRTRKT